MEREKVRTMLSKEMVDSLDWIDDLSIEEIKSLLVVDSRPNVDPYAIHEITKQYLDNLDR